MSRPARVELGKHVLGKGVLDARGLPCGKVDDLVLGVPADGSPPVLEALVTGPLAFAATIGPTAQRLGRFVHLLLGNAEPHPVEIAWGHVRAIDVVVHLDLESEGTRIQALPDAVRRRIFSRIPGA